jgi:hypothetical protein
MPLHEQSPVGAIAVLPADPAEAIDAMRALHIELPPLVCLTEAEHALFEETVQHLRDEHPLVFAATEDHGHRAMSGLLAALRETEPEATTSPERLRPLAVEFYERVGSLAAIEADPVRAALRPKGAPRPKGSQKPILILDKPEPIPEDVLKAARIAAGSPPAKMPRLGARPAPAPRPEQAPVLPPPPVEMTRSAADSRSLHREPAASLADIGTAKIGALIDEDPGALVDELYAAVVEERITVKGALSSAAVATVHELAIAVGAAVDRDPATFTLDLEGFVRTLSRFTKTETGHFWAPSITAERLLPHALHYLEDLHERQGAPDSFETASYASRPPGEVRIKLTPDEAITKTAEVLAREPAALLADIRSALLGKRITMQGTLISKHNPTVAALAETVAEITHHKPANAHIIAFNFMKGISRLVRVETGHGYVSNMTADRLLPHLIHYLEDAAALQHANVPAPYRRALHYSPEEMNSLYNYWVNTKNMPAWAFDGVAYGTMLSIDATMQKIYDKYGPDIPYLKYLAPPRSLHAPIATEAGKVAGDSDGVTLLDFREDESGVEPLDLHITYEDSVARFADLSEMFRALAYDDALAVVVVYDLPFTGLKDINVPALATRLHLRVADLLPYVESQLLPVLKAAADRQGLTYRDLLRG